VVAQEADRADDHGLQASHALLPQVITDVRPKPRILRSTAAALIDGDVRPEDPWLGPDICDYLRQERARGLQAVVISPIGFLCDHIEVLYDLDVEAAAVCREIGLPMVRAEAVNDHPRFLDLMTDMVLQVCRRYNHARPLELVGT
jgi:hypothetical protein